MKHITLTGVALSFIHENYGDGHSIVAPESVPFAALGLSEADQKRLTRKFKSDLSSPKSTIFKDGKAVPEVEGVYLLDLWQAIARKLGVEAAGAMFTGRGFQARALCNAILNTKPK